MKKTVLICITALAVLLAGCAAEGPKMRVGCDAVIQVTVVGNTPNADPDTVVVTDKNRWLCWELKDPNYRFTRRSISITDWDDEFTNCKKGTEDGDLESSSKIACHDKNNKHGQKPARAYKYAITLQRISDGSVITKDPWIVND